MTLFQMLGMTPKTRYELQPETYYSEFLKVEDAEYLPIFANALGNNLSIPSAIIAVGSSVLPKKHWAELKELERKDPDLEVPESYRDIDLLVVPNEITGLEALETGVQETLRHMNYPFRTDSATTMGVRYLQGLKHSLKGEGRWEKMISPFVDIVYGLHSITTQLKNGTKLDLILGRKDLLLKTAEQKIADERKGNHAFSVLYWRGHNAN